MLYPVTLSSPQLLIPVTIFNTLYITTPPFNRPCGVPDPMTRPPKTQGVVMRSVLGSKKKIAGNASRTRIVVPGNGLSTDSWIILTEVRSVVSGMKLTIARLRLTAVSAKKKKLAEPGLRPFGVLWMARSLKKIHNLRRSVCSWCLAFLWV
ncbi:GfV-B27-ORF1 [Ichnoviriform fumiferanae]|uniref:GfV-B27-ORF1 n=1 Tax=Ichnoviriform fumiferanae TaxID=419435 RepID=A2PZS6_9VIRU|nr:GfV-B27-ORF1 [Ichnoviriform fumiferanae]BAF45498.1 GfV-B27-ORF1 [Ichnoviriform fumiferanae]